MIQARGNSGTPAARHWSTAAANASCADSSARSKSRTRRIRVATMRLQSDRYTASTAASTLAAIDPTVDNLRAGVDPVFDRSIHRGRHNVKYMMLICRDEPLWETLGAEERGRIYAETLALSEELTARGQYL